MTSTVFLIAFEYILSKPILETITTIELIWLKYVVASITLVGIKLARKESWPFRLRDIPLFVILGILGEIIYYSASLNAMSYLPIALITVVISLTPVLSTVFDRFIYKRKVRPQTIIGICVSLLGIAMITGVDPEMVAGGRFIGYILAFIPVISTNIYNVIAIKHTSKYSAFDLSLYIIVATAVMTTPYGLSHLPPQEAIGLPLILTVIFLGVGLAAYGLFAYLNSLRVLGSTITVLFSNFVPVVSCVFAWLILGETILPLQIIGGAITLIGCTAVIWFKGRTELVGRV